MVSKTQENHQKKTRIFQMLDFVQYVLLATWLGNKKPFSRGFVNIWQNLSEWKVD